MGLRVRIKYLAAKSSVQCQFRPNRFYFAIEHNFTCLLYAHILRNINVYISGMAIYKL